MILPPINQEPARQSYDVVIIGGAVMGSSVAWFLATNPDFDGHILVVERDPSYATASTTHTNSCIRQQFSTEINLRISQFGVSFLKRFREELGGDPEVPDIHLAPFGYMYLAGDAATADVLRRNQALQARCGVATRLMTPGEIAAEYPFYNLDGILLGSHNPRDEGYFDGTTMFHWWRRKAHALGVEYLTDEVIGIDTAGSRITGLRLGSGRAVSTGTVVNASGPRAALIAGMAGLRLPVEPRKRFTFVFSAERPLEGVLPLTIDPSGVHVRSDGANYLCGCPPDDDIAVAPGDFKMDHAIWEAKVWPALAHRIPAFEAIRQVNSWAGHYAYNTLDQNAVIGRHPDLDGFIFVNGFSGHGLQQAPAMGRGVSELIIYGRYQGLDLSPLGYERILTSSPLCEDAII